jgi:pyridoxine 4-dehydrogenase
MTMLTIAGDFTVNRIGLGTNRIVDNEESHTVLREAIKLGVNFIDTAFAYSGGNSEEVIGNTLAPYKNIVIATKGGMHRTF